MNYLGAIRAHLKELPHKQKQIIQNLDSINLKEWLDREGLTQVATLLSAVIKQAQMESGRLLLTPELSTLLEKKVLSKKHAKYLLEKIKPKVDSLCEYIGNQLNAMDDQNESTGSDCRNDGQREVVPEQAPTPTAEDAELSVID